jgi:hypothetical protein
MTDCDPNTCARECLGLGYCVKSFDIPRRRNYRTLAALAFFLLALSQFLFVSCHVARAAPTYAPFPETNDILHVQFTPPSIQFKGTLPTVIGDCVAWISTNGQYVADAGPCLPASGVTGGNINTANGLAGTATVVSHILQITLSLDPALTPFIACIDGSSPPKLIDCVQPIGGIVSPVGSTDISNKGYVDSTEAALNPPTAAQAATITVLPNSPVYNNGVAGVGATLTATTNGALVIDGYTVNTTDRILVKNQSSSFQNGIYTVSATGTVSTPWTLARAVNFDTINNINASGITPVYNGTVNSQTSWAIVSTVGTVGTDPITWAQYGKNPSSGVTGPGSSVTNDLACWNGTTGTVLEDCGVIMTPAVYVWNSTDTIATMNFTVPATWTGTTTLIGVATEIASGTFTYTVAANGSNATGCTSITATHATTPPATIATCTASNTATQGQDFTVTISAVSSPTGPASIGLMLQHPVH